MRVSGDRRSGLLLDVDTHFSGSFLPEVARVMLEVGVFVGFIENFDSEDGLDNVFEGNKANGGAEFVGDEHDMVAFGDEALEEGIDRCVFCSDGDSVEDVLERACVVVIFKVGEEGFATDDEACEVIGALVVGGNACERLVFDQCCKLG